MPKTIDIELQAKLREWCDRYDNTEEHSAEFNIDAKDEARLLLGEILKQIEIN